MEKIKSKEEILLDNLTKYFYNNHSMESIIPIITGQSCISLRTIDWFVTNYSNKYNIVYPLKKESSEINFNVHMCYKNQLKAFNKRFFDPFCRINKNNFIKTIIFKYNKDNYIKTTIGQINFFKWALENNIIEYVNNNYNDIYNDMKSKKKIDCKRNINFSNVNQISTTINFNNINNIKNINKLNNISKQNKNKISNKNITDTKNFNFKLSL